MSGEVAKEAADLFAHSRTVFRRRPSASLVAVAVVMLFFLLIAWQWSWRGGPPIIHSDVEGYYGYLRAMFITHDLGHEAMNTTYLHATPTGTLNKYFAGEAVLLLPFFLLGHLWAHLSGAAVDGLSLPYQRAIGIAALCYALVGLLAFRAFLRGFGLRDLTVAVVLLVLGLGTQYMQYVAVQPGWSHVYSFALVALFLRITQQLVLAQDRWRWIAWGLVFGLVVLVRPVNGLVLLAPPVVAGDRTPAFLREAWRRRSGPLLAVAMAALVGSIQLVLWHAQVGRWVADGYRGEGFLWGRPMFFQLFFGIRRGLFVWTPVLIASLIALIGWWRSDRWRAGATAVYWLVNAYVIGCWWIWYYGSGWGLRVFVEHYPVLLLPMAIALERWTGAAARALRIFLGVAVGLTLVQGYQYDHGFLHDECMDRDKYAYVFLRLDEAHRDRLGGCYRVAPYAPNGLDTLLHERWDAEKPTPHWSGRAELVAHAPSPDHVAECMPIDEFGPEFAMRAGELPLGRDLYLAVGCERHVTHAGDTRHVLCVATLEDSAGALRYYEPFRMEPLPPVGDDRWDHLEYRVALPALLPGDKLKFYWWNKESDGRLLLDDLDITVMAVRPYGRSAHARSRGGPSRI